MGAFMECVWDNHHESTHRGLDDKVGMDVTSCGRVCGNVLAWFQLASGAPLPPGPSHSSVSWTLTTAGGCFSRSVRGEGRISVQHRRIKAAVCRFLCTFDQVSEYYKESLSRETSYSSGRSSIPMKRRFMIRLAGKEALADENAEFCQFMSPYQISANQSLEQHKGSYLHVTQTVRKMCANRTFWLET